jgi:hypothetical protein
MDRQGALQKVLPIKRMFREFRTVIAGDLRRGAQEVSSAVIVTQAPPYQVHEILSDYQPKCTVKPQTCRIVVDGFNINIVSAGPENWGSTLILYTGPWEFRSCICSDARLLSMKLDSKGLWVKKERIAGREERQIFDVLGIPYQRPRDRRQFMSEARWEKRRVKVRNQAPTERRAIWLAMDTVIRSRKKGNAPAKRSEAMRLIEGIEILAVEVALQWLARHKLIIPDGPKAWRVNSKVNVDQVCWIHGRILELRGTCEVCARKRLEGNEKASQLNATVG